MFALMQNIHLCTSTKTDSLHACHERLTSKSIHNSLCIPFAFNFHFEDLHLFVLQEEDATVWARYSSAQFDQGAGRHACHNPYAAALEPAILENAMKAGKTDSISFKDFSDLIAPSFGGVEDAEDMAAIFARTHLIVLTEKGVYWRVAGTDKNDVNVIPWPENASKDILKAHLPSLQEGPCGSCSASQLS